MRNGSTQRPGPIELMSQMSRLVLMFPGFEPIPVEAHCRRFVREAAKTAPVYGMTIEPSAFAAEERSQTSDRHRQLHGGCRRRGLVDHDRGGHLRARRAQRGLCGPQPGPPRRRRTGSTCRLRRQRNLLPLSLDQLALWVLLHLPAARADRRGARGMDRLPGRGGAGCRRAGACRLGRGAVRLPAGARLRGKTAAFPAGHGRLGVRARSGARPQAPISTGALPCCRPTCAGVSAKPPPTRSCSPRTVSEPLPR